MTPPTAQPPVQHDLGPTDLFVPRHIGPRADDVERMLEVVAVDSLDTLIDQTVPAGIRLRRPLALGPPRGERDVLDELREVARQNKVFRSFIGQGYHDAVTPPVIQRNILENPGWYTQYTPYQAEISQGRLEALLNFQTMVADLTGLPLAGASLLDEATAAAEAMAMCRSIAGEGGGSDGGPRGAFLVADDCHPQTIAVVRTRARSMGVRVEVARTSDLKPRIPEAFGVLVQYPTTDGRIVDYRGLIAQAHESGALVVMAADILALTLIAPPGEIGADIAVGSTQRFGVPMGFGGPHAAYMATRTEYARKMPGRLIGVSRDAAGHRALRLTLQTREQHIRREKATSNICTAQVLLAIMAGMYAVYHGPAGLRRIASRVHALTGALAAGLQRLGHDVGTDLFFDTLKVRLNGLPAASVHAAAASFEMNLRDYGDDQHVGVSLDETTTPADVEQLLQCFAGGSTFRLNVGELASIPQSQIANRKSQILEHPVFNTHHSETELLRYIFKLQSKDLSLAQAMIPLGSCTMKLNATSEMLPVTWAEFARIHPFAPPDQTRGYRKMIGQLERWLAEVTGFAAVSVQPNAGSQGEYAGLLAIRAYHDARGEGARDVCLIPTSAHGTNPASAAIAGLRVVPVACDAGGNVDVADLRRKAEQHADRLACLMVTYPSTHGVFEPAVRDICAIVHEFGGQVYMDGANMNAQVGLCRPGDFGADVCHLNLHKTFCIPHGGGGPGVGPIAVAEHLREFLPIADFGLRIADWASDQHESPNPKSEIRNPRFQVSAAPYGSAGILPIPWMYIAMMGAAGLTRATRVAILSANYMAKRLEPHYPVLFRGPHGRCAHEFILDLRPIEQATGVKAEDVAKRLMDYGFHAPTMSFPVAGTLMIEPTESEPLSELDRFCDAMIAIRAEITAIERGESDRTDNPLRNAPHPAHVVAADAWPHRYTREQAAYPVPGLRAYKFWPAVARVDNPHGDRNLMCTCPPVEATA